jgi:hypothetical protein
MNKAAPLRLLFTRPFGATIEMGSRKPWLLLEKHHLDFVQFTNLYLGGAYIATGEKARFAER